MKWAPGRPILWIGLTIVVLAAASGLWAASLYRSALGARQQLAEVKTVLQDLQEAEPLLQEEDPAAAATRSSGMEAGISADVGRIAQACGAVDSANAALQDISGQVGVLSPLLGVTDVVPEVGRRARAQAATLEAGTHLAAAGSALCRGLEPMAALLDPGADGDDGQSLTDTLGSLIASRPALLEAADRMDQLHRTLGDISTSEVSDANRAELIALGERAPRISKMLRDSAALLDILGAEEPRRFLLVSQNRDELRATGGFIGTAGVLEISGGTVRVLEYGTSRAYDTPPHLLVPVPAPASHYFTAGYWHFAAANWSPSFPDVARQLMYMHELARPGRGVDGVVAVDQAGLGLLLEALGEVEVPEYGETVTADNLQEKLDLYVHAGEGEFARKQFTGALTAAVVERALNARRSELPQLAKAVRKALSRQYVLVSAPETEASRVIAEKRWDGRMLKGPGDYLMLVDTEVTASKHSQDVERDAQYHVDLTAPDGPHGRLVVEYANRSAPEKRPGVRFVPGYRTFLRAYVPAGAELTAMEGFAKVFPASRECGLTVFGGEVLIPAGQTARVELSYRLPGSVLRPDGYELLVQQQPGVPPGRITVTPSRGEDVSAPIELRNEDGRHSRWRWSPTTTKPEKVALPAPETDGCGIDVVEARPLPSPRHLQIPSLGIDAPIVELSVASDGQMESPDAPDVVGWYSMSARGGMPGNSVMTGHVDWRDGSAGVFAALPRLRPGDEIVVRDAAGGEHVYRVEWNRAYQADQAPTKSIVGGTRERVLTLITCEGTFDSDARDYSHRRVVRAKLVA